MDTLYIVIPAYNEEENIRQVINDWYPIVEQFGSSASRLVILDDGSRDRTYLLAKAYEAEKRQLSVITKKNSGHGATVLYGYRYALDHGADYIFQTDSDGQTLPEEFGAFWRLRKEKDLVIGDRRHRRDGISRILVTRVLRLTIRLIFGETIRDANTPYRLMSAATLEKMIRKVPEDYNLANVLITILYKKAHYRIQYIPITFRPRQGGKNSINFPRIIKIGCRAIDDFRRIACELEKGVDV